jgi:hypothetical protein
MSFGAETASVTSWAVLTCLLRALLVTLRLHVYIPNAVLFSCPPLLKVSVLRRW